MLVVADCRNRKADVLQLKEFLRARAVPLFAEIQESRDPDSPVDDAEGHQGQPPRECRHNEHGERCLERDHPVRLLNGSVLTAALMV